ncbi:MAG: protein kinase [Pirellulales bacterium]
MDPNPHDTMNDPTQPLVNPGDGAARPERTTEAEVSAHADAVVRVLDEYLAALKEGQAPSRQELLAQYPQLAGQLEACLAGLEFIHTAETQPDPQRRLGDFRIVREVGRGGMGAVFEAEQLSLGRRVALKILRFGGVSDKEAIERFRREAETVAKLHHTNIVPIFAVGSEHGVNYYAMQFIDGRSLADVMAERPGPLPAWQVAEWGLQAADALAHAHLRGVIHRDVKPSNLLLDQEGRLWLTDFGLARRQDDVTLSLTGVLLGTPRYMSPEQATASTRRVDHRSDLFSLGATLYELLAARPAFSGNTPHDVIQQIISGEPVPIRRVNPSAPLDLETIIMKCLAKDPGARYAAAADLAADLRAFLDGRPIRARRAGPIERAIRWGHKHRHSLRQAGLAVAATVVAMLTLTAGRSVYQNWNRSSVRLDAVDPPLVAELLDTNRQVARVETLPMQTAGSLPAGEYQVRVSRAGTLSSNYDLRLERGQQNMQYRVGLQDNLLLTPIDIERTFDVVRLGEQRGIVEWTSAGLTVRKRRGVEREWSVALSASGVELLRPYPGLIWPWWGTLVSEYSGYGSYKYQPWVLQQYLDVNGDGTGDLILAARHQAWLMAISGSGSGVLWFAPRTDRLSQTPTETSRSSREMTGATFAEPLLVPDVNNDGVADLVVSLVDIVTDRGVQMNRYPCRRWIEAVSGKTGETVWRYDLADELFDLPASADVPYAQRWYPELVGGQTSNGGGMMHFGRHPIRGRSHVERTGAHVHRPDGPHWIQLGQRSRLAVLAGRRLLLIDPSTGQPETTPIELSGTPGRSAKWADLDADGAEDLVFLEETLTAATPQKIQPTVRAWSYSRNKELWSKRLDVEWPAQILWTADAPDWPVVEDLNADGRSEVIVPLDRSEVASVFTGGAGSQVFETPWSSLAVLAGDTGDIVWQRRLVTMDVQIDQFVAGPDINGDGSKEIFTAMMAAPGSTLYVDCLSGVTGDRLWTTSELLTAQPMGAREPYPTQLVWWQANGDGWPQLLVQTVQENADRKSNWYVLAAADGQMMSKGPGITDLLPVDIDGDSVEDFVVYSAKSNQSRDEGGTLHCIRGAAREAWRRLGQLGDVVADLDGDRVADLAVSWGDGTLTATSGATGRMIWRNRPLPAVDDLILQSASGHGSATTTESMEGDLDGDGVTDLLAHDRSTGGRGRVSPLHAISGRTGQRLWSLADVNVRQIGGSLALRAVDLDGDSHAEVAWLAALDHQYSPTTSYSNQEFQLWLFVADGQTGKLRWAEPMSPAYGQSGSGACPYQLHETRLDLVAAELNGDGTLDLLVPAITVEGELEWRAMSGKEGRTLWRRARPHDGLIQQSLSNLTMPTVCDFEQDGEREVIFVEPSSIQQPDGSTANRQNVVITAVGGGDGAKLWSDDTRQIYTHWHSYSSRRGNLPRPVVLRGDNQTQRVAVMLPGGETRIVVYGSSGKVGDRTLKTSGLTPGLLVCDVGRDGDEELALIDQQTLQVVAPSRLMDPIWTRELRFLYPSQFLQLIPGTPSSPDVIVVAADSTDNSIWGLQVDDGKIVWSCPGPVPRSDNVYEMLDRLAVLGGDPAAPPLVVAGYGMITSCRQAARTDIDASTGELRFVGGGGDRIVTRPVVAGIDPRWQRDLPWRIDGPGVVSRQLEFVVWTVFFSLSMVLVPVGYVLWLVLSRRFGMSTFLMLPAVVGLFVIGATIEAPMDNDFSSWPRRLAAGAMLAPALLALIPLLGWLAFGHARRTAVWVTLWWVIAAGMALISLWQYQRRSPLLPEESFDWSSWYQILLPAYYGMACLLLVATVLEWCVRRWRARQGERPAGGVRSVESQRLTVAAKSMRDSLSRRVGSGE